MNEKENGYNDSSFMTNGLLSLQIDETFPECPIEDKINSTLKPKYSPWDLEVIENYFSSNPTIPILLRLDKNTMIAEPDFIESHLKVIHEHNGDPSYIRYIDRLLLLSQRMEEEKQKRAKKKLINGTYV